MKILFICGSIEPGQDGVGDYTRLLASELIYKFDFQVKIIALSETKLDQNLAGFQKTNNGTIEVLRLCNKQSISTRINLAKAMIDAFDPEWISLQYVPYGFHNKGLPFRWSRKINSLTNGRQVNIMFHELWIGISKISPIKHQILGRFQKAIALHLIYKIKPNLIFTSNKLYQLLLQKIKAKAIILPLFANIEVAKPDNDFKQLILKKLGLLNPTMSKYKLWGVFGNLYPGAELENIFNRELLNSNVIGKKIYLLGFGNINETGIIEFNRLKSIFKNRIVFLHLGKLMESEVSNVLQLLDLGFSTTPPQHIGKSGVYAIMRLHNVKVMLPKGEFIPEYGDEIKKYNDYLENTNSDAWSVNKIALSFIDHLKNVTIIGENY